MQSSARLAQALFKLTVMACCCQLAMTAQAAPNPLSTALDVNSSQRIVRRASSQSDTVSRFEALTDRQATFDPLDDDDLIDAEVDLSAVDDGSMLDSIDDGMNDEVVEIPSEVAHVPLNAISPKTLKTFVAVVDLVRRDYVDEVNDETLFNNAMSGMLTKLDSHAEFLDLEAYQNLKAFTEGDVGDIGIKAKYQDDVGYWVITSVVNNSPADKKGMAKGDYLHQIGEVKLDENKNPNDIEQLLTGVAGSQVDVVTSKAGRRKHTVSLQRNNNHPQTIGVKVVDGLAIIKLPAFQNTSREQIMDSLTKIDAPVLGILLDLRDNPGGVLASAVQVASLFMENTDVVQIKSRHDDIKMLSTKGRAILKPLPVVVLQNRYSASAAEVLASSLQSQKRATIVGEVSYGKGSVQSVIPIDEEHAVKLTVAHYLTANGGRIETVGVQPDRILSGNESTWEAQALAVLKNKVQSSGLRFVQGDNVKTGEVKTGEVKNDNTKSSAVQSGNSQNSSPKPTKTDRPKPNPKLSSKNNNVKK